MSLADRLAKAQQKDRISEVRGRVQEQLVESLGPRLYDATMSDTELEGLVHQRLRELLDEEEGPLSAQEKLLIVRQIGDSVLGLGPLEPFVRDPEVTEIMVNNWDTIYVERAGKLYWTGTKFHDDQQLRRTIDKIVGKVGRRVDEASPYVDARLPDGSRVNAVIPPLSIDGPALTIRKFAADPYQADDLIEFGTMTSPVAKFLEACVRGRINILVAGGTGAGKTTRNAATAMITGRRPKRSVSTPVTKADAHPNSAPTSSACGTRRRSTPTVRWRWRAPQPRGAPRWGCRRLPANPWRT